LGILGFGKYKKYKVWDEKYKVVVTAHISVTNKTGKRYQVWKCSG